MRLERWKLLTGSHSHGQGHETPFAQLVSERLGVVQHVAIVPGDTDQVQMGMGTYCRARCGRHDGDFKGAGQDEAKAKRVAAAVMERQR